MSYGSPRGCVTMFLSEIMSYQVDAWSQFGSWIICLIARFMNDTPKLLLLLKSSPRIVHQAFIQFRWTQSTTKIHAKPTFFYSSLSVISVANPTITLNIEARSTIQSSSQTRSRGIRYFTILLKMVYIAIYICLQAHPVYYLWSM
jgi:hypothetical protein